MCLLCHNSACQILSGETKQFTKIVRNCTLLFSFTRPESRVCFLSQNSIKLNFWNCTYECTTQYNAKNDTDNTWWKHQIQNERCSHCKLGLWSISMPSPQAPSWLDEPDRVSPEIFSMGLLFCKLKEPQVIKFKATVTMNYTIYLNCRKKHKQRIHSEMNKTEFRKN